MGGVQAQYKTRAILDNVFICGNGHTLLMFGCNDPSCEYSQEKRLADYHVKEGIETTILKHKDCGGQVVFNQRIGGFTCNSCETHFKQFDSENILTQSHVQEDK